VFFDPLFSKKSGDFQWLALREPPQATAKRRCCPEEGLKEQETLLFFKKKKQENTYFWGFASHSGEGAKKKCFLTRFFLKKVGAFALFFETRGRVCGFCERFFFEKKNQETFDV